VRYRVELRPAARRYLDRLAQNTQRLIIGRPESLEQQPRPGWSKPLHRDLKGRRSFRVAGYRVIYQVEDDVLIVLVIHIGPHSHAYEDAGRRQA